MTSTDEAASGAQRSRLPTAVLGLSVLGVLISSYLTYEHFTSSASFACPETSTINCVKVTTSTYSELVGVPVAVLGLGFYLAMTLMALPAMWRRPTVGLLLALTPSGGHLVREDLHHGKTTSGVHS